MVGSANAPVIMGPRKSSAGRAPEDAEYTQLTLDEDQRMMALRKELAALHQHVDRQECSASHAEGDEAEGRMSA